QSSAGAASDTLAPTPCAMRPVARQRPRRDVRIVGGGVSFFNLPQIIRSPRRRLRAHGTNLARPQAETPAYWGGSISRPTATLGAVSDPSGCFCAAAMNILAPTLRSAALPGV